MKFIKSKKNNKDRWSVYRIYKGIDSIIDVDGTFKDKNDKSRSSLSQQSNEVE